MTPFFSIETAVEQLLRDALRAFIGQLRTEADTAGDEQRLTAALDLDPDTVCLEQPRNPRHGDWATGIAMQLARPLRRNPFEIAQAIVAFFPPSDLIAPPEIARPGFINLRLADGALARLVRHVLDAGAAWGRSDAFAGRKVLVEFVSANPTGPLHIGHCRGAVVGDALARLLAAVGYDVSREYYYNDAGVQMKKLGESLRARYLQALGEDAPMPEDGYMGDYMVDLGRRLMEERGDALRATADTRPFTLYAAEHILKLIDDDLKALRIDFDTWFSETTLHEDGSVRRVLERLKSERRIYEKDGAWWLRTAALGDEKDRVVIKSDGEYTYLAPDIAYHEYKFNRGFDRLVNVLGADHHGYVPRLKASVAALGYRPEQLDCVLVQMVGIKRGGETIKLSTRAGDFITLKQVIDEIGPDVTRFLFLMRSPDSQMVFDFDLARDTSMDNPLYYVQYAHARCCSLMRKAEECGAPWRGGGDARLDRLTAAEEKAIVRQIDRLPASVQDAASRCDPMLVTSYLTDLATAFHAYFTAGNRDPALRVVQTEDTELTQARLTLIEALRLTLANGLRLLGVEPLERL
ncbi:MAG TPA: arginine--tRNA ligase [Candidatus Sumerlaeota bacterium]|nr:arginine--tRNA ligase [Candidatus Sumerlaeota bacterium]